jgi:hypothetical protein
VAAFVLRDVRTVHPDVSAVIHGPEVQQQSLFLGTFQGRVELAGVPDDVVKSRLPYAG